MAIYVNAAIAGEMVNNIMAEAMMRRTMAKASLSQEQQVLAEKQAGSLRLFSQYAWQIVEPKTNFVPGWHIDAICEHLEAVSRGEIRQLLINMPPRHMKSLLVSVFWPCWEWINHPEIRWLFSSYGSSLSVRDNLKSRRILKSPWFLQRWGDRFSLTGDQNTKTRYENDKTGYRIATSVNGATTGEGGDRIICDDPHNVREAPSQLIRDSTISWWDEAMSTRVNNPQTSARVIIMQRVHQEDLSGHVLEQGGWEHLCLPARYESNHFAAVVPIDINEIRPVEEIPTEKRQTSIGWEDPRDEDGELLWPQRFNEEELAKLERIMGPYAAAGQLQQRPSPAEGGILKRSWFKFYRKMPPIDFFDTVIQSWDMSFKGKNSSDPVVGQIWGRHGSDVYLLHQTRGRMGFSVAVKAVQRVTDEWPQANLKLVEDKANGPAIIESLQGEIAGIVAVNPRTSKEERVEAITPFLQAGNVWLPDSSIAPWIDDFVEECAAFPNGSHDDQVDAMTQAVWRLLNSLRRVIFAVPTGPEMVSNWKGRAGG